MKWFYGFLALCFAIFLIDLALVHWQDFRKRRNREREMAKYNLAAFRATKANSWWLQ
jgi:hypothetical protein